MEVRHLKLPTLYQLAIYRGFVINSRLTKNGYLGV